VLHSFEFQIDRKFRPRGPVTIGSDQVNLVRRFCTRIYGQAMSVPIAIVLSGQGHNASRAALVKCPGHSLFSFEDFLDVRPRTVEFLNEIVVSGI